MSPGFLMFSSLYTLVSKAQQDGAHCSSVLGALAWLAALSTSLCRKVLTS